MEIVHPEIFRRYPDLVFGMSTRNGGVNTPPYNFNLSFNVGDDPDTVQRNREIFYNSLRIDPADIAFPIQCHSSHVRSVSKSGTYPDADALITDVPNIYLAITVADCLPVFLYVPGRNIVAGIHAGWKGTSENICMKTVRLLHDTWQVDENEILAYIGPAAGICCYEVGPEVAGRFDNSFIKQKNNGKFLLDLPAANKRQLIDIGLLEENITSEDICTICSPNRFHSYRRDGKKSGRMMAIIGLRK
jgi:polyphenol oxidase